MFVRSTDRKSKPSGYKRQNSGLIKCLINISSANCLSLTVFVLQTDNINIGKEILR